MLEIEIEAYIYAPCCSSIIILAGQQVSWKGIKVGYGVGVAAGFAFFVDPTHTILELHGYVPDSSLSLEHLMLKTQSRGESCAAVCS